MDVRRSVVSTPERAGRLNASRPEWAGRLNASRPEWAGRLTASRPEWAGRLTASRPEWAGRLTASRPEWAGRLTASRPEWAGRLTASRPEWAGRLTASRPEWAGRLTASRPEWAGRLTASRPEWAGRLTASRPEWAGRLTASRPEWAGRLTASRPAGRPADRFAPGVGRPADRFAPGVGRPADRFAPGAAGPARRVADPFEPPRADADQGLGYAPTYYPGATGLAQALPVTLGLSSEVTGVDFGVLLVPTARVSGTVLRADGVHPGAARVMLVPEDRAFFRGATSGARVEDDGRFEIRHVAPGRYILRAVLRRTFSRQRDGGRPRGRTPPMFASQALEIDGFDVTDLTLVLGPGARLSGSVDFDTAGGDPDDVTRIRVSATPLVPNPMIGGADARVQSDGTFELEGIADGARLLRTSGAPTGWVLQAVYLDGRDVIDTPLDFGGASHLEGVRLVFSDRVSELSGVVHDRRGEPLTDFTVIAFPPNEERWQPASRFIRASRPDQNGSYRITGLPAGDYLLAAVDVVEQGEWYDPRFLDPLRAGAVRLRLGAGEAKALNLTLSAQQ